MNWHLFIGHAVFFGSLLVTLILITGVKLLRARHRRRSPMHGRKVGHVPGQQLLDRIEVESSEVGYAFDVMILSLPLLFLFWATAKINWANVRIGLLEVGLAIGWLACLAYGVWKYRRHEQLRERARDGLLAERVTGMQLNRLVAQGCLVLHDLPCEVGNIDHVVIAPRGVYAVETKSFRKPVDVGDVRNEPGHQVRFNGKELQFPDFVKREPVEQAVKQAEWLRRYLRDAVKLEVPIIPAIALPGWYIVQDEEVWRTASVKVFTPLGDGANFMSMGVARIDPEQRQLLATALAQLFPATSA
ncbi:MAG: nuclease-related domain-containing protein [Lysobacteraceae bacterium]